MPNATVRASARSLPETTSRRAILGAVLAAGAQRPRCQQLPSRASRAAILTPSSLRSSNAQELPTLLRTRQAWPLTMFCLK